MQAHAVPVAIVTVSESLCAHHPSVAAWSRASFALVNSGRRSRARLAAMTKWEYATVPLLVHATKQILDNWGDDGWELVSVVPGPNSEQLVAYMKREKS
jgi:hypothetical protein